MPTRPKVFMLDEPGTKRCIVLDFTRHASGGLLIEAAHLFSKAPTSNESGMTCLSKPDSDRFAANIVKCCVALSSCLAHCISVVVVMMKVLCRKFLIPGQYMVVPIPIIIAQQLGSYKAKYVGVVYFPLYFLTKTASPGM
jgi:hypothetical protein